MIKNSKDQKQAQKKLQAVKRQLYGQPDRGQSTANRLPTTAKQESDSTSRNVFSFRSTTVIPDTKSTLSDISYLRGDLMKITVLSIIAIGIQTSLWYMVRGGWLKMF